jgi:hypothetical protein
MFELASLTDVFPGEYVKVKNSGNGRYVILEKMPESDIGNFVPSYNIVFSEKATIKLLDTLWDYDLGRYFYDITTLEETLYDQVPDFELYYVLMALKNDIFVRELKVNWNLFFFAAVKYALTEQKLLDWAFKTSFVNVVNTMGNLDQRPVYRLDNESYYEEYVNEVKPYRTKIRTYKTNYTVIDEFASNLGDLSASQITDFDLPSYYNTITQAFETIQINSLVPKSQFTLTNTLTNVYPWKDWADNYTYEVGSILVADGGTYYTQKPTVSITTAPGDYGSGATAEALIRGGSLLRVAVTNPGKGYVIPPIVKIEGGGPLVTRPATISVTMSNNKVRRNTIGMRFDRISKEVEIAEHDVVDRFECPGNQNAFILSWLADYDKFSIVPTLDGKVVLSTEYTIEFYTAPYAGYNKRYSRFVFLNSVPAEGQVLVVRYKKNLDLYNAIDRIERYYAPTEEMPGKDYPLLMTGLEYPGTQLQGLKFEDTAPWGTTSYDSSPWGDLINSFSEAKLVTTATIDDTVLYLNTTTGILPGQSLSVISTATGKFFREDTVVDSVNNTDSSITIFSPSYAIKKVSANGTTASSTIEVITFDDFNGNFRINDTVSISGISTPGYNGQYQIFTCTNNRFWVLSNGVLGSTTGTVTTTATARVYSILTTIPAISSIELDRVYESSRATTASIIETYALFEDVVTATVTFSTGSPTWTLQASTHTPARANISVNGLNSATTTLIDVRLYGNTNLEFWGNNTDYKSLDSAINGGTWQGDSLSGALGVNPEDIIIDGDTFINPNSSHAPEEFVPGHVLDSLGINVYTQPEVSSPSVMTFTVPIIANQITRWPLPEAPENPMGILLYFNGTTFQRINNPDFAPGNYFTVQGKELLIAPQAVSGRAFCTMMFVGADTQLDSGITVVDRVSTLTNSGTVVSLFDFYDVKSVHVTLNGDVIPPYNGFAPGYLIEPAHGTNNRASVRVMLPDINKKFSIEAWFFKEPYAKFNKFYQETFVVGEQLTSRFVLNFPPKTVEPASTQAIVETGSFFELRRMRPPSVSYYRVLGDETVFDIDNKRVQTGVHTLNTVKVYLNGAELRPGFDWTVNSAADTVNIINGLLTPGDVVAVMSLLEYDYFISNNILTLTEPVDSSSVQIVKVTTFPDHDNLFVRTERFEYNAANEYTLSLPVINENYIWISAGSQYLSSGYEFSLLPDMRTVRINDTVEIDPNQEMIITTITPPRSTVGIIGYRIFKDIFENQSYKRLSKYHTAELERPLSYLDKEIYVKNGNTLAHPNPELNLPGVILLDAERIEYFTKNGNVLTDLRRSTLGTGPSFYSQIGTKVIDQSVKQTVNTYEERLQQHIFTSSNVMVISTTTATGFAMGDGIILNSDPTIRAADQVEVYYGGRKLRKSSLVIHDGTISYDTSTESLTILAPEFSINTSTQELTLNIDEEITTATRITVVQRLGAIWTTTSLLSSDVRQAVFLRARPAEFPDSYYYGGETEITDENSNPLFDETGTLEGF